MARNKIKLSSGVIFVVLLIGANVLLLLPQEHTKKINYFFVRITSPLVNLIPRSLPEDDETVSKNEYNELLRSYENLQGRFQHVIEINNKVSGIRQRLPMPGPAIVIANISKMPHGGQRSEIVINKGSFDKLRKGQYVLSAEDGSVIGVISELSKYMSRVKLLTDAKQHIVISIRREGVWLINGQMNGNNQMQGKIPYIETSVDIRVNDSVFAELNPGYLETPLIIGTITEIKEDDRKPLLWDITVSPIDNVKSLTDVAVVVIDMDTSDGDGGK